MLIRLPYDNTELPLYVGDESLENPVGTSRLQDLAKGKMRVTIVTSDHTRAVPSKITLPILLEEIRRGSPQAEITILIATGLHRETTREEQIRMFGPEDFIPMGALPPGAGFFVNRLTAARSLWIGDMTVIV